MIAEVCRFYHWSFDDCWRMPARRFFVMLNAARRLEAAEMIEQCDIAAITICSSKWYDHVRGRWERRMQTLSEKEVAIPREASPLPEDIQQATAERVKELFAMRKRLMGYV